MYVGSDSPASRAARAPKSPSSASASACATQLRISFRSGFRASLGATLKVGKARERLRQPIQQLGPTALYL